VIPFLKELGYGNLFREAFPHETEPVSPANYGRALQAYQATLATPSPFDQFLSGDDTALDAEQKAGLDTFLKIGCADCHDGPLLGGGSYQKFGMAKDYWSATGGENPEAGRFSVTKKESDRYVFRVQMLRNIAKTAPYFHDGSVAPLHAAVQVMAEVQLGERLTDSDAAAISKFLHALTGEVPEQFAPPPTFPGREGSGR
jgi:cytochrome c peroxidase